jgi:hypothetical protein
VPLEGFLDALDGGSYLLVDRERLTQVVQALAVVAVLEVGPAESFQSMRSRGTLMSRAMASARVCWSRARLVAEVRDDSSPRRLSASAWPRRSPKSRNSARA